MSEFAFFVIAAVSAGFCFWPYFRRQAVDTLSTRDTPLGRVEQRKETLMQNISDLDFEYNMGKLAEEDYQALRNTLMGQAAEAVEQIDVLTETDEMMGRKVATKAAPKAAPGGQGSSDARTFCSQCGTALEANARFCSSCGHKLA